MATWRGAHIINKHDDSPVVQLVNEEMDCSPPRQELQSVDLGLALLQALHVSLWSLAGEVPALLALNEDW